MEKEIRKRRIIIICAFIIGLIGIGFFSYDFVISKINLTIETINLELYGNKEPEEVSEETSDVPNDEKVVEENDDKWTNATYDYVGYLEIPIINLKQGFVSMDSSDNDVDKNIQIIKPSNYPDEVNGNFILASHSGSSSISYFKNLYQLDINDDVIVYYQNKKYSYRIAKIYEVEKNGTVAITRDKTKTTITLITCTKGSDDLQTVYVAYLESVGDL